MGKGFFIGVENTKQQFAACVDIPGLNGIA